MNPISKLRFDSLAGYSRSPWLRFSIRELAWFEEGNEKVLGVLALDLADSDYDWFVLGRDKMGCFRAVWVGSSTPTEEEAHTQLEAKLAEYTQLPPEEFYQGDEMGNPLDFFTPISKSQHDSFRALLSGRGYSPARNLLIEMMRNFVAVDRNFVENFQSEGFDARLWELYMYALFTELGCAFDREHEAPDFHCLGPLGEFFVEATTVNHSDNHPKLDISSQQIYFEHYVPLMFGGALFGKLNKKHKGKKYWELPHVQGMPLIFAVQDFREPGAMSWSSSALLSYLYGIRQVQRRKGDGSTEIISESVGKYTKWNGEEITPFFLQPDSENISAVLANSEGTISKFNRMGFLAGYGDRKVLMFRSGNCYMHSVTPEKFSTEIHSQDYSETWREGVSVYHNPRATHPLPVDAIPGAAHHFERNKQIMSRLPEFHPLGSTTMIIAPN